MKKRFLSGLVAIQVQLFRNHNRYGYGLDILQRCDKSVLNKSQVFRANS